MAIPCKNCLKLPICNKQKSIRCQDFYKYFEKSYKKNKGKLQIKLSVQSLDVEHQNEAWKTTWFHINKILPIAKSFYRGISAKNKTIIGNYEVDNIHMAKSFPTVSRYDKIEN